MTALDSYCTYWLQLRWTMKERPISHKAYTKKTVQSNTLVIYRSLQKYTMASDYSLHVFTVGKKVHTYIGHCICIP